MNKKFKRNTKKIDYKLKKNKKKYKKLLYNFWIKGIKQLSLKWKTSSILIYNALSRIKSRIIETNLGIWTWITAIKIIITRSKGLRNPSK